MLHAIIRFSIRNKLIVGLFTVALIALGIFNLRILPIDALPDITSNQVQIITSSPSLAAPEVERLITFPLEQANASIPGIREMRSISRFGLSVVTIVFDDETDVYWARQQVGERLNQVRAQIAPEAGSPEMAPATTGIGEIYQYVVRPAAGYEGRYDLTELRSIQDWIVRRQLLGTPGVADVSSFGGYLKQYEVAVVPDRLKSLDVTIADIFTALEKNNQNSGGAYIEKGPTALFIRTEGLAETIEEIEKIVVRYTGNGMPVRVGDVSEVRIGRAIRYGAMTYRDRGEVAGAVVLMLKGANASKVIQRVKDRIEQIRQTLPEGIILETFYDRTKMVNNAIGTVKKNLLEGALIVVFVLVLFLGNLRAGLIVASVIPLAMLFAITMMNLFGVSGNLMSLGALDFGLIVDGAVIIVEAILHRLSVNRQNISMAKLSGTEMNGAVEGSASKMMNSAVFGQIVILIVYLPILTLTGIEGKMFKPMAQTVSFALIGAFLLSLTYVPMMSALVLSRKLSSKVTLADRIMSFLQRLYTPLLRRALQFPKTVVGTSLILFAAAILIMSRLGGEFIPEMEEGDFAVDARILTGSSLTETIRVTQQAAAVLEKNFPEVEKIVTRIGASEIPTDPMPLEMTDIMISLKPRSTWTSASSFDELANQMSRALQIVPGLSTGFQFPVQMRFNELISGARQDVVCKLFGEDLDSLANYAALLGGIAGTVPGARDIYVETITGLPQIVIKYDRDALARFQLNIAEVNRLIRAAFAGESAGLVYEKERRYDLVVRLKEEVRADLRDVQELIIPTAAGLHIPLYQVADISIREGPNQIQREDAQRRVIVGFNVRGRDVESVVQEIQEKTNRQLKLPAGYFVRYGGQFENMVEAKARLSLAVPAALALILIMLYFAFGSLKYGLLIFSAIPLSAIGGVIALWIRGMPFSISAGVGFIALFGVAVLNGIVLLAEFNRLKKETDMDIKSIVKNGTRTRLRPVLMTAAVASLGFLPMALSQGSGAEVQRPLATVVIGGLVTATFLTLIVLPVLYTWLETKKPKIKPRRTSLILIVLCFISSATYSQQEMPLVDLLQKAASQNLELQGVKRENIYWQQLGSAVFDPGKTIAGGEFGGISSARNDTRFFINQSFSLPIVYRRQREYYGAEQSAAEEMGQWKLAELNREVKMVFFEMVDARERKKLLLRLDSIYGQFLESATLRWKTGETNQLEKTNAEAQVGQLKLQLQELDSDIRIAQTKLQWLLHTEDWILPDYDISVKRIPELVDSVAQAEHPLVRLNRKREQVAATRTKLERSQLSPDIGIGYSNQSIIGFQSSDGITQRYYPASHRFQTINLTLGIPLFNATARSRIRAAKTKEEITSLNTSALELEFDSRLEQVRQRYKIQLESLRFYESTGLQQSETIIRSAEIGYKNGNIGFLEWTVLMNNAVSIKLNYLQVLKEYHVLINELEYLTEK